MDTVQERVRRAVAAFAKAERFGDEEDILKAGIIDSLDTIQLIFRLEQDCGITIGQEDLVPEHWRSVSAITALVLRKKGR